MELDFVSSDLLEDEAVEVRQNVGGMAGIEGERCGICMDIIIDRGVLDCCQHWFCFECIDNWSTIMNLCPLCQSEFQLITCVPVYDTGGSSNACEDSPSRDDEWCIEAETDALSSPSYYIDENAVACLDGDGCKIRSGSTCIEGDSNIDTSIACDSCDTWYHAFCVGFGPENASDDTWLCPRCLSNEKPHESDAPSPWTRNCQHIAENSKSECAPEVAFSGNFSVSIADDGETAIVVSMVKGNEWFAEPREANLPLVQDKKNGDPNNSYLESCGKRDITKQVPGTEELPYAISSDLPPDSKSLLVEHGKNKPEPVTGVAEKECLLEDELKSLASATNRSDAGVIGAKRKHSDCSGNGDKSDTKNETAEFLKKSRVEEKEEMPSTDHENVCISNDPLMLPIQKQPLKEVDATVDILSIVKGTGRKPSKTSMHQNFANKSSKERENVAGLRVKKITRKALNDKESSVLVEKLRKEIREAVRNKPTNDIGENLFDPKLLAAFRAAMAGPKAEEPPKKLSPVVLRAKKSMLQKGRVRENLTKKIYADSNGKRRSAWHRDCEIEFWRHRALRTMKPEKINTLKSVLSLLRKNPVEPETKPSSANPQPSNPILSRLYLADTSVFPRKDDIKPLSAFKVVGGSENDTKTTEADKASSKVSEAKNTNLKATGSKPVSGSEKSHLNNRSDKQSSAASSISKTNSQKQTPEKLEDLKKDKRKWALEVLARKKALAGNNSSQHKKGDNAVLKGNYPLLAQLPTEMRPVLASSHLNKIPVSIRQTQLYRLTEHFLKKANLPIIRRTAATELAVADAINIEKAIADQSNSKVVYLNLCSQEILHHSESRKSDKTTESKSSPPAGVTADDKLDQSVEEQPDDPAVQEALRTAGLLSDSPPNSPTPTTEVPPDRLDESPDKAKDEGPDNVFEIVSNTEVDVYGDFEYDLDDEDYIGATASAKASEVQMEEDSSKVKVVLSTVKVGKSSNEPDATVSEEKPINLQGLSTHHTDTEMKIQNSKHVDGVSDKSSLPLIEDQVGDLSLAECEELYGPDKESPIGRTMIEASAENQVRQNNYAQIEVADSECESNMHGEFICSNFKNSSADENLPKKAQIANHCNKHKEKRSSADGCSSITKKVEAYIKEHIRPLCRSGVIKVEEYKWAVTKTTEKVMKYHSKAKNANFLIKEGEKVKKLAEQYVQAAAAALQKEKL